MSDTTAPRFIYSFGGGKADAGEPQRHLVGGKGASLAEMTRAGLDVPPGFTISTECCDLYYRNDRRWPDGLERQLRDALTGLEALAGRKLGQGDDPLLVAVRSGAAHSMPGMMDTLLNVGLNPDCVAAFAERTGDARAAWAAYRDFLAAFGTTAAGIDRAVFDALGSEPTNEDLCRRYLDAFRQHAGREMPDDPWEQLRAAVTAVFDSWMSERAVAYRARNRIEGLLGTAVNVQMMCPSEVSGVMFTADPVDPARERILIEAAYGLGESVVLGKVEPDRFVLDHAGPTIRERSISAKGHIVAALTAVGRGRPAPDGASLTDEQLLELARLGLRVEEYFRVPCDIEWGLSRGRFYLLQARAIRRTAHAVTDADREQIRREEIAALRSLADPRGTVWARFNLSEILPEPTPMSWAVVRRFMSGRGGFGRMYRDLGFDPDPALDEVGIFDLVCGRPYCNLSREPRLQYRRLPFEHPFDALKAAPQRALYPQAVLNPALGGWRFWLLLPVTFFKLWRAAVRQRKIARTFADRFRHEIAPPFLREAAEAAASDWSALDPKALLGRFEHWRRRTLDEFGRDSLKPTALAGLAMAALEQGLARYLQPAGTTDPTAAHLAGVERARAALCELVMGVRPDPDADLPGAVRDLAAGRIDRAEFLRRFGHRGNLEMELSQPRWAEQPSALDQLAASPGGEPAERPAGPDAVLDRVAHEADLNAVQRAALSGQLRLLHTYLGLRETAKDYLMRGFALIRRALAELDRRYDLDGGIFFLTPDELPGLVAASSAPESLRQQITARRRRREVALSLAVPQVLFSDDLEAIGREPEAVGSEALQGVPLSAGVAEAPALVLEKPGDAPPTGDGFILVCPSTDPAWVPLFVRARGLVMETGGVLSHGAIVAREFGLPAVAGLPDVHRRLRTGQRLRVDGGTGRVNVLA